MLAREGKVGSLTETYSDPFFVLKIIAHEYKNQ